MQAKALLTDDYGKDLASVEALIRRHDELERDLTAIENKLEVGTCYTHTCIHVCASDFQAMTDNYIVEIISLACVHAINPYCPWINTHS